MLLGLFKNVNRCVLDSPKVVYFWRIQLGEASTVKSPRSLDFDWTTVRRKRRSNNNILILSVIKVGSREEECTQTLRLPSDLTPTLVVERLFPIDLETKNSNQFYDTKVQTF